MGESHGLWLNSPAANKRIKQMEEIPAGYYASFVKSDDALDGEDQIIFECVLMCLVEVVEAAKGGEKVVDQYFDMAFIHPNGAALVSDGYRGYEFREIIIVSDDDDAPTVEFIPEDPDRPLPPDDNPDEGDEDDINFAPGR